MATLNPGQSLIPGLAITSANGLYSLKLQMDGNFVLYRGGSALWNTHTNGKSILNAIMQNDGNLVLYDPEQRAVWSSQTSGQPGAFLSLQNDGNLVIYHGNKPIWATMTNSIGAVLTPSQQLTPGQAMTSSDGQYTLTLQTDGNFVLYGNATPMWNTHTNGKPSSRVVMQTDGNLVLYDSQNHALWNSGTWGHDRLGVFLTVQDDGNVVVGLPFPDPAGIFPLWDTNTAPPPTELTFSTGEIVFPDGIALGGFSTINLYQDGRWEFSNNFHESGGKFNYGIALAITDSANPRHVYTFAHQYSFGGGVGDDIGTLPGQNVLIAQNWSSLVAGATLTYQSTASLDVAGLTNLLEEVISAVETAVQVAIEVIQIVGPLIAGAATPIAPPAKVVSSSGLVALKTKAAA